MSRLLARLVQVREGEERLALLASGFFLLVQAAQVFAVNAGDTLLLDRFGVEILPRLFVALGAATLIVTTVYAAILGRPERVRLSLWILAGASVAAVAGWVVTFSSSTSVYPWLWLGISLVNAVIGTLLWVVAGEVCDARQAKRLFALFASAGILGSVLAGFATGPIAGAIGAETMLLVSSALVLAGVVVGGLLSRRYARVAPRPSKGASPLEDLRTAHHVVISNPTMRLTAAAAIIFSVLFFSVSYPFNVQVAHAYPEEAELAGFFGTFGSVVTGVTFIVSLVIASRVYARIGVIGALLLLPLAYLGGFILWSVRLDLTTAVLFRFVQLVLLGGVAGTAFSALFNVVPAGQRAQVRAYQSGPPAQLGVMLSGVLLLLGQQGLTLTQTLALGLVFSAVCAAIVWRMRRTYGASLVAALRQGLTEVFTESATPLQAIRQDSQAVRVATRGLEDPRPSIRRLSAMLLGQLEADGVVDSIRALNRDPEAEVRMAAAEALRRIPTEESRRAADSFLDDLDPSVRAAAISSDLTREVLLRLGSDVSPAVRSQAAVALAEAGHEEAAQGILRQLVTGSSEDERLAGLRGGAQAPGTIPPEALTAALDDRSAPIRAEAARALRRDRSEEGLRALVAALDDDDSRVRRAAGRSLRESGRIAALVEVLSSGPPRAQDEAITSLAGPPAEARRAVLDWTALRMVEAERLRAWAAALTGNFGTPSSKVLRSSLALAEEKVEQQALRGLASAGSAEMMRTVSRGLRSKDRELRAQAVEALESVADRLVSGAFARLLDADTAPASPAAASRTLLEMAGNARPWFRALAFRARAEQNPDAWTEVSRLAAADPHPIVRQAVAASSPAKGGGDRMETGQTLGIVERVLFLREVPLFRLLEPEDLEPIAATAQERLHTAGEFLCLEGELGDELFVLVDGSVEVSKTVDGERHVLRSLEGGEHLGELAILREQPRSASVRALTDTRTLTLSGDALRAILEDRPEVALALLASLAERMSSLA